MHTGRCSCGRVTFDFDDEPVVCVSCHCRDCQYAAGGHPTVAIAVPKSSLRVTGEVREYWTEADSGTGVYRSFCPQCGTPLFAGNERSAEIVAIKLGALDDPSAFAPELHIWTSSAQPWHYLHPDVKQLMTQ